MQPEHFSNNSKLYINVETISLPPDSKEIQLYLWSCPSISQESFNYFESRFHHVTGFTINPS